MILNAESISSYIQNNALRDRPRIRVKLYHEDLASDRILHVSWAYLQMTNDTWNKRTDDRKVNTGTSVFTPDE
jgi:hypothetical protein